MKLRIWRLAVSTVAVVSLVINVVLVVSLLQARSGLQEALMAARNALALSAGQPLAFDVAVDQEIPVRAEVPIDQVFVVPIEFVYPLDAVVNTYIDIPLLGRQEITVPVETVIPISHTLEVPIQLTVPISMAYHLQADIPVEVALPAELLRSFEDLLSGLAQGLETPLR